MTASERRYAQAREQAGYKVFYGGWPDFLMVAPDGTVSFVELKDAGDVVRPNQAAMHAALTNAGLTVAVVGPDEPFTTPVAAGPILADREWLFDMLSRHSEPVINAS